MEYVIAWLYRAVTACKKIDSSKLDHDTITSLIYESSRIAEDLEKLMED